MGKNGGWGKKLLLYQSGSDSEEQQIQLSVLVDQSQCGSTRAKRKSIGNTTEQTVFYNPGPFALIM